MEVTINEEHEEAVKLLFNLIQNYGVVDAELYNSVEDKYPQYFNENGFIDYCNYLNIVAWMPNVVGYCAYILLLNNNRTYKGYTSNFIIRMISHFNGTGCKTTHRWKPKYILHYEVCDSKEAAIDMERYFKSHSGMDKIFKKLSPLNTIKPK